MLNQLKFDFYKAIKSKGIIIAFIASFFNFIFIFVKSLLDPYYGSVMSNWLGGTEFALNVIIFSIVFCSQDFASGYLKNVYSNTSKLKYVLSKTLGLLAYTILYFIITFLLYYLYSLFSGDGRIIHTKEMYDKGLTDNYDSFVYSKLIGAILTQILGSVALGLIINLLCVLFNRIIVGIVTVVWMSSSFSIYGIIDELLLKHFTIKIEDFTTVHYTVIWNLDNIHNFVYTFSPPNYHYTTALIVFLVVGVISFLLSWLAMCKKNF